MRLFKKHTNQAGFPEGHRPQCQNKVIAGMKLEQLNVLFPMLEFDFY